MFYRPTCILEVRFVAVYFSLSGSIGRKALETARTRLNFEPKFHTPTVIPPYQYPITFGSPPLSAATVIPQ